jgi:O-antigen/teichoic acid export membrane protein
VQQEVPSGSEPGAPAPESLQRRVIRGSLVTAGGYAVQQALRLGSNLILTHLLAPELFGLMSLVWIVLEGLHMFSDFGLRPAIISSPRGLDRDFLNTAWTIGVVRGVLLWIGACVAAPIMAAAYQDRYPELSYLLPIVALGAVIEGFHSTNRLTLLKQMSPTKVLAADIGCQLVSITTMVVWAGILWSQGRPNIWPLVSGPLVHYAAMLFVSHLLLPGGRNWFRWDKAHARELLTYGRWVFVSTLFTFLARQTDRLILAKLIEEALFGVYGIAFMAVNILAEGMMTLVEWVAFPAYAKKLAAGEDVHEAFRKFGTTIQIAGGAGAAVLIAGGPDLVEFLYDDRYLDAGWMLRILGVAAWFMVLEASCASLIKALAINQWMAAGHATKFVVILVAVPLGFHLYDVPGALLGLVAADVCRYAFVAWGIERRGYAVILRDLRATVFVAVTAGMGCLAQAELTAALPAQSTLWSLAKFALVAAVTAAPWAAWALVTWRRARAEAG